MDEHVVNSMLMVDLADLTALLEMKFGPIPSEVMEKIEAIRKPEVLQRLILVAANAPKASVFLAELAAGDGAFRLVGQEFNPLRQE
ncbi:MAG: hypothetical protein OWS03_08965 [Alicyclobacillaceae bacterium]|nr:hypothetical protein [Alicyclobacillaceae bacterium]